MCLLVVLVGSFFEVEWWDLVRGWMVMFAGGVVSNLSVLGHRQEELELRGQLLFRVEAVGEVDAEGEGENVSDLARRERHAPPRERAGQQGAGEERKARGRGEEMCTGGCGSWRGSAHGGSRCSWCRTHGG